MSALTGQDLAVALAEAGYVVVPIPPKSKVPKERFLRPGPEGKRVAATIANPLTPDEVRDAKTDDGRPWKWWGIYVTGDLIVIDADDPAGMREFFGQDLPVGPTVRSSRGFHYWLRAPTGAVFSKTRQKFEHNGEHVGEIKMPVASDRASLAVLPGQWHKTGMQYAWEPGLAWDEVPLPDAPPWLMLLLAIPSHGTTSNAAGKGRATEREKEQDITSNILITSNIYSLSLAPAFQSDEFAQRVIEAGGSIWPGVGKAFRCVISGHATDETGTRSAAVFRGAGGRLRCRCFLGHEGAEAWSLVHLYAYLKTKDLAILGAGGLGKGVVKLWAARALLEFGMVEPLGGDFANELREPTGVSDKVLNVWRGFLLGLQCQMLYDTANIYVMVYSQKFAAHWCGVAPVTAYRAIGELVRIGFLLPVGKTGEEGDTYRANAYAVGPAAFRWGSGPDSWYPGGQIDKRRGPKATPVVWLTTQ